MSHTDLADDKVKPVLDTLRVAFEAFNDGDIARFHTTWAKDVVAIINEPAPHVWVGHDPVTDWLTDGSRESADDVTHRRIELARCLKSRIDGESAFVVLVVTVSGTVGNKRVEEDGIQISNLILEDGVWKVRALAYGGGLAIREIDLAA